MSAMVLDIRRWRPRHLLGAWAAYWAALLLAALGPAMLAIARVSIPEGAKGTVSAGFGDGTVSLTVLNGATTTWSGSAQFITLALWIAGPPLLIWIAWLLARPTRPATVRSTTDRDALPAGEESVAPRQDTRTKVRADRSPAD